MFHLSIVYTSYMLFLRKIVMAVSVEKTRLSTFAFSTKEIDEQLLYQMPYRAYQASHS
jgi:hypothetical protein